MRAVQASWGAVHFTCAWLAPCVGTSFTWETWGLTWATALYLLPCVAVKDAERILTGMGMVEDIESVRSSVDRSLARCWTVGAAAAAGLSQSCTALLVRHALTAGCSCCIAHCNLPCPLQLAAYDPLPLPPAPHPARA